MGAAWFRSCHPCTAEPPYLVFSASIFRSAACNSRQETTYHGDHGGHGEGVASPSGAGHQPQRNPTFVPSGVFGFVSVVSVPSVVQKYFGCGRRPLQEHRSPEPARAKAGEHRGAGGFLLLDQVEDKFRRNDIGAACRPTATFLSHTRGLSLGRDYRRQVSRTALKVPQTRATSCSVRWL